MSDNTDGAVGAAGDDESLAAPTGVSRRGLLGLVAAGVGTGALIGGSAVAASRVSPSVDAAGQYAFRGEHQAGIVTPAQDRLHFAAFDLTSTATRDDLIQLLKDWTAAAERLTQGLDVSESGSVGGPELLPPDDTGEAQGLAASGLTITFGFGPSLFRTADGTDRFGLADRQPAELATLPLFAFDLLEESASDGDLCIQACANDPQVAVHAIRNLSRIAFGTARIRWSQLGFGRTSSTSTTQATPRNLFGFKDGTANVKAEETEALRDFVWVGDDEPQTWMHGGSYLVTRTILMTIENWDRVSLGEQNAIIGRDKGEGAPLSGGSEFSEPDFELRSTSGEPAIPEDAHVRLAHPTQTGTRMLRRGYNFVDGSNELGQLRAGLFFMSYQRSPQQFIDVQSALAKDSMNEYIRHVGSAIFAVPPGTRAGEFVGSALFA
ncbi:deferrochelatase/peroxidase EfeB [Microbacteriaceae bacterium SG_E_30_P1]|uniref:Deferrochelatase n=1 Tax=Antiquaquibacter oligotrophicus TaxID=2880260 RepID=A0ABT6KKV9_9MICO|nr:iron uptake transporter deferrochelatase/peroxidase subunit [Antiquaquibacter oligotrophicus]MDH6180386.1 deferrochelatase/peroxidase EfeB [Antiquaquibacter oligotrophicus]UDF13873.1 deferrochelatase/peroxidase EfeB [Antiquaquibacter oligotrophicus]